MGYIVCLLCIRVAFMTAIGFVLWVLGRIMVEVTDNENYVVPQVVGVVLMTIGIAKFLWKTMP